MTIQFKRNELLVHDEAGNVLRVIREIDNEVKVYLNGHIQGGLEQVS